MYRRILAALGAALLIGTASAQERPSFAELDSEGKGVIDRATAAQAPEVAANFDEIDRNQDGVIDQAEYARWLALQDDAERD